MASTIQVDKIQDTGGNTILQSDGSGTATTTLPVGFGGTGVTARYGFSVYLSGEQTISATTLTTVPFDTERFDLEGNFDTTTYTFTAPIAGKYLLAANMEVINAEGNTGGHYVRVDITTSNKTYQSRAGVDLAYAINNQSVVADMDASDTAIVKVISTGDSSYNIGVASGFFGWYLG
jgi:hypothetical protein